MPPWPYVTDESGRVHGAEEWKAWQNIQIREKQSRVSDPVEATEPSPSEARMMWLEREVLHLQRMLHEPHDGPTSSYWSEGSLSAGPGGWWRQGQRDRGRSRERSRPRERGGGDDGAEEVLRSYPVVLPKLGEPGEKLSALMAGDWITQVRPLMADVSEKAGWWWDQMVAVTTQRYLTWLEAPPLTCCHRQMKTFRPAMRGWRRGLQIS